MVQLLDNFNGPNEGVMMDKIREDGIKLQSIMQYMESRGLMKSLAQLQAETELEYKPWSLPVGALIDESVDLFLSKINDPSRITLEDPLTGPEPGVCATELIYSINAIHGDSNPTCIVWHPSERDILATGGVDKRAIVRAFNGSESPVLGDILLPSPALSMDWHGSFIAVGCMGGDLIQIEVQSTKPFESKILTSSMPHGNSRLSHLSFSDKGTYLASSGKCTVYIQCFDGSKYLSQQSLAVKLQRDVSAMCWIADDTLIVAESDNPLLLVYRISQNKPLVVGTLCMNLSTKDPLSAYSSLAFVYYPSKRLLLSCTNRNSALLFCLPDRMNLKEFICPIKTFHGMTLGPFDIANCEFSSDGTHVYITSDRDILVFETVSGHKVFSISKSGNKPIRCLKKSMVSERLGGISFDKSLFILE